MTTTVKFIGSFRSISGKDKLVLKSENSTPLRAVIKRIVKEYPKLKRALIDPELQEPKTSMLILVNGKEISVLNGLETMIKDGDEVVFVPVVHGG
jgi:molybdopterin synthase sulfur carrier subunit